MGWRDIQAGVNDGSVSFVQKPEEESNLQGINRALGNLHQIRFNVRPEITVFTLIKL